MAYTRRRGSHDKVTIDGTDVSNSFRRFGRPSAHADIPVGGFSPSGFGESLDGETEQSFEGEAFYTEELAAIVEPIHSARSTCLITWQPYGLVDSTREIYSGNCKIYEFSPSSEFGAVQIMNFVARAADENGITVSDWT